MANEVTQRVFILPENHIKGKYSVIRLKHPKSKSTTLCALDSANTLYEIVHFRDEFSSWFIENTVVQDGSLYLLTVVDPLFFLLPYVNQNGKFCPLEDLVVDENFPEVHHLLKCCSSDELLNIFDSKESAGYKVFCYNNTKTLHWLQQKVNYLSLSLKSKNINVTDGSKAASLQANNETESPEILQSYACHLISDYLSEELASELFQSLGLQMKPEKSSVVEDSSQGKSKKQNMSVSPTDDYSKKYSMNSSQEKQKSKLSVAQKQLLKVDKKGMKTISSFFAKK